MPVLVAPPGGQSKDWVCSGGAWGICGSEGQELAVEGEGTFIVTLGEWSSTSPWKWKGGISRILITIKSIDVVSVSPRWEEGRGLGLEEMLEGRIFEVCGALEGNARQGADGFVGGRLERREGCCPLVRQEPSWGVRSATPLTASCG